MKSDIKNNFKLKELLEVLDVTESELRGSVRTQRLGDARALFAAKLIEQPGVLQTDIAKYLHTTQPAVSLMLKRHNDLLFYPHYRSLWQKIQSINIQKQ